MTIISQCTVSKSSDMFGIKWSWRTNCEWDDFAHPQKAPEKFFSKL